MLNVGFGDDHVAIFGVRNVVSGNCMPFHKLFKYSCRRTSTSLVMPLSSSPPLLLVAGGKAANLTELIHAGFAVPPGFCVTTAAYILASAEAQLGTYLSELKAIS
jgi:hypothetical protein